MGNEIDFAIVGGGASGIYSAWRLAHATPEDLQSIRAKIGGAGPLKISVFERSKRIGGRLLSASPRKMPSEAMELGGMRYLSNQPLVKSLVEDKLKAPTKPQAVDEPTNFAYLRSRIFRQSDLVKPGVQLPYNLTEAEKALVTAPEIKDEHGKVMQAATATPAQLIFWAVYREFPQIEGMDGKQLREFLQGPDAKVDGRPLYHVGFWNLLSRHLSSEGRELAITAIGYDVLGANANAVDIIAENMDFTADSTYSLFVDGFESVIWTLGSQLTARGSIHYERTLESFDSVRLDDAKEGVELTFEGSSEANVTARAIVLALPQAAIKALRRTGPLLDPKRAPEVPSKLNSVEGIPLYELFVIYDTPWWQEKWSLTQGRTLTDLPVRQCYYWSTNVGAPSAIMAYNDQASTSFWGGYQTGELGPRDTSEEAANAGVPGPTLLFHPEQSPEGTHDDIVAKRRKNWDDHKAPHEMVSEMHRQLMEIHGVKNAPEPIDAAFMDWMNAPYGGAVHFWNPGYQSWKLVKGMTQPVENLNAFVVGESYSTVQTWVEGAFQTSEIFLQMRLGMQPPEWSPTSDYSK